ncbi:FHA domain-containing protein [Dictyobacter aurantiacus]|uniref:FHA domain-containing protein n=1 Tax=Dictyobacter aurantiacus TaxID=1936993 RepID=A0A401ZEL2_9CHLR|nr:FHA domain-containing protein [Dictyobacter aurantiacus]GCE05305.1 hypothetical protein KDAU_26340 [Dictyobacter aurantiacus]
MCHRGTNYQFTIAVAACLCSASLLLPVFIWYHFRFNGSHIHLNVVESWGIIVYASICGWINPIVAAVLHWFFSRALRSDAIASGSVVQSGSVRAVTSVPAGLPRYQKGVESPFVFRQDVAWGWLEYRNGNFQGQRLALKRMVASLGREDDCDIWLDDEMASRHHAELAWHDGQAYLTDCGSLNGILLNGQRVQGSVPLSSQDQIEIGHQQFNFIVAEQKELQADQYDPLVNHTWRSTFDLQADGDTSSPLPAAVVASQKAILQDGTDTFSSPHLVADGGYLLIKDGERMGQRLSLDGKEITIGRGLECMIMLNDVSVAQVHAQIYEQAGEFYLRDSAGRNDTFVNEEVISEARKLNVGDTIKVGTISMEFGRAARLRNTTMPPIPVARSTNGGFAPLRLPSRTKHQ